MCTHLVTIVGDFPTLQAKVSQASLPTFEKVATYEHLQLFRKCSEDPGPIPKNLGKHTQRPWENLRASHEWISLSNWHALGRGAEKYL